MTQSIPAKSIGDKIAFVRKDTGLSQEAFARQLGISRSAYQHYERSEHDVPASVLRTLCSQFEIDPVWVLFEDGEKRITARNNGFIEIIHSLSNFVEDRANTLDTTLSDTKKWEVIHFIAADFLEEDSNLKLVSPEAEEKIDNIIRLIAA